MGLGVFQGTGAAQGIETRALYIPACVCGCSRAAHQCSTPDCGCQYYEPCRPPRDLGVRAYQPKPMPFTRYMRCKFSWWIEVRLQRWRERLESA